MIFLGRDLNGHVVKESSGYERMHGGQGFGEMNELRNIILAWVYFLMLFRGYSIDSLMRGWRDIAFSSPSPSRVLVLPSWSPPPVHPVRLNFEGSALGFLSFLFSFLCLDS